MELIGTKDILLKEEGILLRRFKLTDAKDMFYYYCNDEIASKYLTWLPHGSIEVTKGLLQEWINEYEEGSYRWAIEYRGKVIGSIDLQALNLEEEKAILGYVLSRDFWGKGIMTKVLNAVIKFSFEEVNLKKLEAMHLLGNPASGKVMIKNGMKYIKIIEGGVKDNKGIPRDVKLYSLNNYLY